MSKKIHTTRNHSIPEYSVKITKQKGIRMRVTPQGKLIIHANPFCTKESIEKFIQEHVDELYFPLKSSSVRLFGRSFQIRKVTGSSNHVSTCEHELIIQAKDCTLMEKVYQDFLKQTAKDVLSDISDMIFLRVQSILTKKPKILIRRMSSSWGVCHPDKGSITLNSELIHYPVEFIEYVICHEFIHMIEPNHSPAFYAQLCKVMPDYKRRIDLIETSNEKQYLM